MGNANFLFVVIWGLSFLGFFESSIWYKAIKMSYACHVCPKLGIHNLMGDYRVSVPKRLDFESNSGELSTHPFHSSLRPSSLYYLFFKNVLMFIILVLEDFLSRKGTSFPNSFVLLPISQGFPDPRKYVHRPWLTVINRLPVEESIWHAFSKNTSPLSRREFPSEIRWEYLQRVSE